MALIPKCTGLLAGVDSYLFCAAAAKISRPTSEYAGTMYLQLTYTCILPHTQAFPPHTQAFPPQYLSLVLLTRGNAW